MQQFINHLLDLHPICPHFSNQANCLQAIHETIQQFNEHLKTEHLDRQTLQLLLLQLQGDSALLRYLLFPNKDIAVENSDTSPLPNPNTNPNPNPNPTSSVFPLCCNDEPKLRRSTPVGAVGAHKAKTNNSVNADFQRTPNTQDAPPTTVQNLTSRICKLEKLFADEIATYLSITEGIHSQYYSFYDKIRHFEPGNSDAIIWKIHSVKFVFESAKVAQPSSDPLIEPDTSFSSHIFRTHPHGYNFFCQIQPLWYWIGYWQVCINPIHPLPW